MIHIYLFFLWGYFKEHKSRILFSLLGISLGIALFFTTQVNSWRAEESIIDSQLGFPNQDYLGQFQSSSETKGEADSILRELYFSLPEHITLEPSITQEAFLDDETEELLRFPILGKDVTALLFQKPSAIGDDPINPEQKRKQVSFLISKSLFDQLFQKKNIQNITLCEKKISLSRNESQSLETNGKFIIADIQYLQSLCGYEERIQRIILKIEPGYTTEEQKLAEAIFIAARLNWTWESKGFIRERSGKALGSLKINLTIVSLISVLISFFMVANTFSGIYLARRKEFGILLSIGNSRFQNLLLFQSQAVILGFLGSVIGIGFGWILLKYDFLTASNTLADASQISSYQAIPFWIYLTSASIGIVGSIFSALFSSIRSFSIRPIELIREKDESHGFANLENYFYYLAFLGISLCILGLVIGLVPMPKSLIPGLLGVGLVIFGFIFFFPFLLIFVIRHALMLFDRFFFFPTFKIAWEEIRLEPLQNTLTSATILLSSSLVLTLTALTDSYEKTLLRWIDEENNFEYSIINISKLVSGLPGVPENILEDLMADANIKSADPFIIRPKFPLGDNYYTLHVYPFTSNKDEIMVSSNFCYLEKRCKGDNLAIQTESKGKKTFKIVEEREHFFSERGTIMMNVENYREYFSDFKLNSVRITFKGNLTEAEKLDILNQKISNYDPDLKILNQNSVKNIYLDGMRSVFSILISLKISAVIISFLALLTSLIYNIREKSKLIASLRAIGLSSPQLFKILFFQSFLFILLGLGIGILNSFFISPLVIYGVNRNAFGWALDFYYPFRELGYALLLIPVTAFIVSIYPFLEANRKALRESLNYE
jgi:putative ABC transport system permease protein